MEIKLSKWLIFLLIASPCNASSQNVRISQVNIKEVAINGLDRLDLNPQEKVVISNFGKPKNRVIVPPQPEWDDGGLQLFYENNTEFYYSKQGDNYYLENINLNSKEFSLIIEVDTINIGSSLAELRNSFKESFEYFMKYNPKPYKKSTQEFYIIVQNELEGGNSFTTNITIRLSNDMIKSIYINLVEGN